MYRQAKHRQSRGDYFVARIAKIATTLVELRALT
jgi:hypothetical protein